ncbi:MAG: UDP-N-acetylmuramate dehydrogenase [Actinomycetota bacterium]
MSHEEAMSRAESILRAAFGDRARNHYSLAPLTTFRIGGPADLYVEPESTEDLAAAARAVSETGLPFTVLGKGSNVLVSDSGFPGLVIRLGKAFRWAEPEGGILRAGAAMPVPALAGVALTHSLAGLEFGVAIPASLGGAVRMNAGAHGHSMEEIVEEVEVFSFNEGQTKTVPKSGAGFSYRGSSLGDGAVVTGASLALKPGEPGEIRRHMDDAREWRRATQPLAEPNCGSVFKNPPDGQAARLIEEAGAKGMTVGGARVSEKHANFIVTTPEATSADVLSLMLEIQNRVQDKAGVLLECEVQLVGEFDPVPR